MMTTDERNNVNEQETKRPKKEKQKRITKEKLYSSDYFRNQLQFDDMEDKVLYATIYNFLADLYKENAKIVRNHSSKETIKKLKEVFIVGANSSDIVIKDFNEWVIQNTEQDILGLVVNVLKKHKIL